MFQVIGYIVGWQSQRFELTIFIVLGTSALLVLLTVPAWPLFKQNELKWLEPEKLSDYVREHGKKEKQE